MGRLRSEDLESGSIPRRAIRPAAVGPDEIGDLSVRKRHQWPGSTDGDILAPEAVEQRHLSGEVSDQLGKSTVHHVTVSAVASQDIAAGGATVQWGDEAGAPNERRGFETFHQQLQASSVGDIPLDLTGELEMVLDGLWAEYRASGSITITRTRDGSGLSRTFDLGPVRSRLFGGSTLGWPVKAGDTIRVDLPNDSGEDQTLAEATIGLRVIGAQGVPEEPFPEPWMWWRSDALVGYSDGDMVAEWPQRAGPITLTSGDDHFYVADAIGSHGGVRFTGGSTFFNELADQTLTGATFVQVFADNGADVGIWTPALNEGIFLEEKTNGDLSMYAEGDEAIGTPDTTSGPHAAMGWWDPDGNVVVAMDGTVLDQTLSTVGSIEVGTVDITPVDDSAGAIGKLVEVLMWDRALTADERASVWAYLAARYPSLGVAT